jgi:hypothetical protein
VRKPVKRPTLPEPRSQWSGATATGTPRLRLLGSLSPDIYKNEPTPDDPGFTLTAVDGDGHVVGIVIVPEVPGKVWPHYACAIEVIEPAMHTLLGIMNTPTEEYQKMEDEEWRVEHLDAEVAATP